MPHELWADVMAEIDEKGSKNTLSHLFIADGTVLVKFCRDAVVVLRWFRAKVGVLRSFRAKVGDVFDLTVSESIHAVLSEVVNFLRSKSKNRVMADFFLTHLGCQAEVDRRTFSGMEGQVKEAVLVHVVEKALVAVESSQESCLKNGAPLGLRETNRDVLEVLHGIEEIDRVLHLDLQVKEMYGINDRIVKIVDNTDAPKQFLRMIEDLQKNHEELLKNDQKNHEELLKKMEELQKNHEDLQKPVRAMQADGWCPRAFFIVPRANEKWWSFDHLERWKLLTKEARLYFMCHMMWEDLDACGREPREEFPSFPQEISKPIYISIPRDFLQKRGWVLAIRISLKTVNILSHAAAFGLDLGSIISGLGSIEGDKTFENFREAIDKEPPPEEGQDQAHVAVRDYLEKEHGGVWRSAVMDNLNPLYNQNNDLAYVCKNNVTHKDAWENKSMP